MLSRETATGKEASLSAPFNPACGGRIAKASLPYCRRLLQPVNLGCLQQQANRTVVDAPLSQVGRDSQRPLPPGDALTDESLGESLVIEIATLLQQFKGVGDQAFGILPLTQLALKLTAGVFPSCQKTDRLVLDLLRIRRLRICSLRRHDQAVSEGSSVLVSDAGCFGGMRISRSLVFSVSVISGFSFRNCRTLSLP